MVDPQTEPALLSILVATDDHAALIPLTTALLHAGHVVHSVRHGDLVVEAAKRYKADVCILYMDIPGGACYRAAEELDRLPTTRRPLLIGVLESAPSPGQHARAQATGFDRLLTKPMDAQTLLTCIREFASRPRSLKR